MKHSNSPDQFYVVEKIVGRRNKNNKPEYLVRWKGFLPKDDTWEPIDNIQETCGLLIEEYETENKSSKLKRDSTSVKIPQRPSKVPKISPVKKEDEGDSPTKSSEKSEKEDRKFLKEAETVELIRKILLDLEKSNKPWSKSSIYRYLKNENYSVSWRKVKSSIDLIQNNNTSSLTKLSQKIKAKYKGNSGKIASSSKSKAKEAIPNGENHNSDISDQLPKVYETNQAVFFLPSASPLKGSLIESSLNSLPHVKQPNNSRSFPAFPSDVNISDDYDKNLNEIMGKADTIGRRRARAHQVTTSTNYKSIVVRKNPEGFTEIWLQSPGAKIKNSFTVQVLLELKMAFEEAINDTSRLVLISGIGEIFSSGIDLAYITKWSPSLPSSSSSNSESTATTSTSQKSDKTDTSSNISTTSSSNPTSVNKNNNENHKDTNSHGNDQGKRQRATSLRTRNSKKNSQQEPSVPKSSTIANPPSSTKTTNSPLPNAPPPTSKTPSNPPGAIENTSEVKFLLSALRSFLNTLISFPKPIIAGVNGPAIGLGVAILPLCDLVYASDKATFYLPYTRLSQTPEGGSTYSLASLIGMPLANDLLLAGRKLSAREAQQRALVSDVIFPKNFKIDLMAKCRSLAKSSPMALEMIKCIIRVRHRPRIEYAVQMECQKLESVWQSPEFVHSAYRFLESEMTQYT